MGNFVKFLVSFLSIFTRIHMGLHAGKILSLACRIFPAMARAIVGEGCRLFLMKPSFERDFMRVGYSLGSTRFVRH